MSPLIDLEKVTSMLNSRGFGWAAHEIQNEIERHPAHVTHVSTGNTQSMVTDEPAHEAIGYAARQSSSADTHGESFDTHGVPVNREHVTEPTVRPNAEWVDLRKPSAVHHDDVYVVRLYRGAGGDAQVYTDVKHLWWTANHTVLTILQYTNGDRSAWRTIYWMREHVDWYTMTPQPFE